MAQIQDTLKHTKRSITRRNLENTIRPRGSLTCGIDASSLSVDEGDRRDDKLVQKILRRIKEVQISSLIVRHSIRVRHIYAMYTQAVTIVIHIHTLPFTEANRRKNQASLVKYHCKQRGDWRRGHQCRQHLGHHCLSVLSTY
jgi:hypothetical protein